MPRKNLLIWILMVLVAIAVLYVAIAYYQQYQIKQIQDRPAPSIPVAQ